MRLSPSKLFNFLSCFHFLVMMFLVAGSVRADNIALNSDLAGTQRTGLAEIWHDPSGTATIHDAASSLREGKFKPLNTKGSTGLVTGAVWSHFRLTNPFMQELKLDLEYIDHQLMSLDVYERQPDGHYQKLSSLRLEDDFFKRPVPHNRFVVPVSVPSHSSADYLVRFSSEQSGFIFPSMRIWSPKALQRNQNLESNAIMFLFGGFFLMSLFAFVAGIATSEKVFFAYSVYSFSKITVWATILGYTHQYLITENFQWNYLSISGAVSIFCGLVFARIFLQSRKYTPKLDYVLLFMMINAAFLVIAASLKIMLLSVISITIALLLYPMLIVVGVVRWRQGSSEAAVFSLAWSLLVFGLVIQAMRDLGYAEHNLLNYYWPPFASFTEMMAIMAAIGIMVRRLRSQKHDAETMYRLELESSKSKLEKLVQERTQELEQAKMIAEKEARTDALTGVQNRRSFIEEAEVQLKLVDRLKQPASLLMLDIDHFKSINDTYGHATGDEALQLFARSVQSQIRENDIFGRIGGEEFALFTLDAAEDALITAERIRQYVSSLSINVGENTALKLTVSIGVASLDETLDLDHLMHDADAALYEAKNLGRDRAVLFRKEHSAD